MRRTNKSFIPAIAATSMLASSPALNVMAPKDARAR